MSRSVGTWGEAQVANYLRGKKFRLVAHSYHCRFGEIDLIVQDGRYLVFVEVKYRKDSNTGFPEEAVDYHKQMKISRTAQEYLLRKELPETTPCRFDVVAVCGNNIHHIRNAFDCAYGW